MIYSKTQSQTLPVSINDLKHHLRVDISADDDYIETLIRAANAYIEEYTGFTFVETTYKEGFKAYAELKLAKAPVIEVDKVEYLDGANEWQEETLSKFDLDNPQDRQAVLTMKPDNAWGPINVRSNLHPVRVTYKVGTETIPPLYQHAVKLCVGTWYEVRASETEIPVKAIQLGLHAILDQISLGGYQ